MCIPLARLSGRARRKIYFQMENIFSPKLHISFPACMPPPCTSSYVRDVPVSHASFVFFFFFFLIALVLNRAIWSYQSYRMGKKNFVRSIHLLRTRMQSQLRAMSPLQNFSSKCVWVCSCSLIPIPRQLQPSRSTYLGDRRPTQSQWF